MSNKKQILDQLKDMDTDGVANVRGPEHREPYVQPSPGDKGVLYEEDVEQIVADMKAHFRELGFVDTHCKYPMPMEVGKVCSVVMSTSQNGRIWAARYLGTNRTWIRKFTKTPEYISEVRRRMLEHDAKYYIDRANRWVTPIDKVLAGYYACGVKPIRDILNEIDEGILDSRKRSIELRDIPIDLAQPDEEERYFDTIEEMLESPHVKDAECHALAKHYPIGQRVSGFPEAGVLERAKGVVVGYHVYMQFPKPLIEFEDGRRNWNWRGALRKLK